MHKPSFKSMITQVKKRAYPFSVEKENIGLLRFNRECIHVCLPCTKMIISIDHQVWA